MSADSKPPDIEISPPLSSDESDSEDLKNGTRTPRRYQHDGQDIRQDIAVEQTRADGANCTWSPAQASTAESESGTEADDERPNFVKALPAPHLRHKGLKTGEQSEDVLLTPSQLDDDGKRLSQGYFKHHKTYNKEETEAEQKSEAERLRMRRLAEFARRTSEVALMLVLIACVLCGKAVLTFASQWQTELLIQVVMIALLVLAYPVKLSIVDSTSQAHKLWQRFRVPASFDPATVLYPPLLPVLVALSIAPANSAVIMPNIVLGLSSLPQRLFPRSSRVEDFNVLHWLVAIMPLMISEHTDWLSEEWPTKPYMLKRSHNGLLPESLVLLYPLHHSLLQPLQYLTTTSLLVSELHLLSASMINLLMLATSPQMIILKSCLWVGGVILFLCCAPVLGWNVTLMRIPKWKFRRSFHPVGKRKSFVTAVKELVTLQQASAAFKPRQADHSDADDDHTEASIKHRSNGRPKLKALNSNNPFSDADDKPEPKSALELHTQTNGFTSGPSVFRRPRRNTLPERGELAPPRRASSLRSEKSQSSLPWYLHLTAAQAQQRKWLYSGFVYLSIFAVVLAPVRYYVLERALYAQEPIGWASSYLFGQVEPLRSLIGSLGLAHWVPVPPSWLGWDAVPLTLPPDVPLIRTALGQANVRLLLIAYWAIVLFIGLIAVFSLTAIVEVDTRRKVFHGVMVAMMLPSTFIDPCACALALALVLAVFLLLEIIRAGQLLPLGTAIARFVAPYVDGRDLRGPVVVSHIFLLIGCAVPLWFSLASLPRAGSFPWIDWELADDKREVAMIAGVVCVGMGDAAASLIGRRYGRRKWPWVGGKSLEGSAAFAAAVTVGLMAGKVWLVFGGWNDSTASLACHRQYTDTTWFVTAWATTLAKGVFCGSAASFMEAVLTGANDNVVVPVALWLLVKGVRL